MSDRAIIEHCLGLLRQIVSERRVQFLKGVFLAKGWDCVERQDHYITFIHHNPYWIVDFVPDDVLLIYDDHAELVSEMRALDAAASGFLASELSRSQGRVD